MCLLLFVVQDIYVDALNTSVTHPGMLLNSLHIFAMASEVCKVESAVLYIPTLFSYLQVSQQVNYAKGMFEERRYTLISDADNILED
jgi:hypothetical protein